MRNKILYWLPRVLAVLYISFLSLFALDVFEEGAGFFQMAIALFMHLIPNIILIIALILAWKYEIFGWAFIILGIVFMFFFMRDEFNIGTFLLIGLPLFILGVLFLWNYYKNIRRKK